VGNSPGRDGIAGELLAFKGTSDPLLGQAIGKRGDSKSDVWERVDNGTCGEARNPLRHTIEALQSATTTDAKVSINTFVP
jgi:hypothetical protein